MPRVRLGKESTMRDRPTWRAILSGTTVPRRVRTRLAHGHAALKAIRLPMVQAALGASGAWFIAVHLLGHVDPVFAPITAMLSAGIASGQPPRRALELVLGVAFGIGLADALVQVVGSGVLQMGLLVILATAASVFIAAPPAFVGEAAISAVIVVALPNPGTQFSRMIDAVAGTAVAAVITLLILPSRPLHRARGAAAPVLDELAASMGDVAVALRAADPDLATAAVTRARNVEDPWMHMREVLDVGHATTRVAPARRHEEQHLRRYVDATTYLDFAIRDARLLARGAVRAIELEEPIPAGTTRSIEQLESATRALADYLNGAEDGRRAVMAAAEQAFVNGTHAFEQDGGIGVSTLAGQVRSTAVDLAMAAGIPREDAVAHMRSAVLDPPGEDA